MLKLNIGLKVREGERSAANRGRTMACYVMLEFTAKKGTGPALLDGLRAALPITRSKDGCQNLELTANQDNPDNIIMVVRGRGNRVSFTTPTERGRKQAEM